MGREMSVEGHEVWNVSLELELVISEVRRDMGHVRCRIENCELRTEGKRQNMGKLFPRTSLAKRGSYLLCIELPF